VNETFAKKFFNGQEPHRTALQLARPKDPFSRSWAWCRDGKYNSLGEDPKPALYTPLYRDYSGAVTLVARTRGDPRQVLIAARTARTPKLQARLRNAPGKSDVPMWLLQRSCLHKRNRRIEF